MSPQSECSIDKDSPDRTHHSQHDNGVSVRHIVTEIEAICHPVPCLATPSSSPYVPLPLSSHSPQLIQAEHQVDAETSEVLYGSLTPPSQPPSPSMLPCDWPAGSVRRATKQLEQKLRQEMELAAGQRSPLHSPGAEHPPVRLSTCPLSAEHPPLHLPQDSTEQRITQGEIVDVSPQSKDQQEHIGSHIKLERLNSSGMENLQNLHISHISGATPPSDSHMLAFSLAPSSQSEEPYLDTSAQSQRRSQSQCRQTLPQACSNQMTVVGVTVQESDTDDRLKSSDKGGCGPSCEAQARLVRGSQELERIQQTLKELQAFLHEGISLETTYSQDQELGQPQGFKDNMDAGPDKGVRLGLDVGQRLQEIQEGKGFSLPAGWHRAVGLEARIRQAGLTPPSFMKRSASLAKLDCLELSANDLTDLDLRQHTMTLSCYSQHCFSMPPSHHDDTLKKQKVLAGNTHGEKRGRDGSSSSPSLCFSSTPHLGPRDDTGEREEPDGFGSSLATTTRPLQGRGPPSRRSRKASAEKKQRAVTVLYNTM